MTKIGCKILIFLGNFMVFDGWSRIGEGGFS